MSNHTEKIIDMLFLLNVFNFILNCPVDGMLFSFLKFFVLLSWGVLIFLFFVCVIMIK